MVKFIESLKKQGLNEVTMGVFDPRNTGKAQTATIRFATSNNKRKHVQHISSLVRNKCCDYCPYLGATDLDFFCNGVGTKSVSPIQATLQANSPLLIRNWENVASRIKCSPIIR